jgi:transcriptional regulator with XRE-family HTH domain
MPEIARIGSLFATRRIQLGLTQQLLADLAGVSRYSIRAVEYGTGSVKLASITEIAEIQYSSARPKPKSCDVRSR